MTPFTERQRAELRDAVARSRREALDQSRRYEAQQRAHQRAVQQGRHVDARDLLGLLAENATALEAAVADLDDDELSRATFEARQAITRAGNRLALRKFNRTTTAAAGQDVGVPKPAAAEGDHCA